MKSLAVIILNYRRAELTIGCLESLAPEMSDHPDWCAVLVDNASDDGSADELERAINSNGWSQWLTFVRSPINTGFAGGNNIGFRTVQAEHYLLLNSDARVRHCAMTTLLGAAAANPRAGLIGPELQDPDATPQISCFRYRSPVSEMLAAAGTGVFDSMLRRFVVAIPKDADSPPDWVSFACILIRRDVLEQVGEMDEGYFMYFEDIDFARRVRKAGWDVVYEPRAKVVHLRGGTSSVKAAIRKRQRIPRYYYEARSRYFAKFYGGIAGLVYTNAMWLAGRSVSLIREILRQKKSHTCLHEARDNWTNTLSPMKKSVAPGGGDL